MRRRECDVKGRMAGLMPMPVEPQHVASHRFGKRIPREPLGRRHTPNTNAAGATMGMPRNGCSTSKSLSPLSTSSARPLTASSRNLSSVASRHALIVAVIATRSAAATHLRDPFVRRGSNQRRQIRPCQHFKNLMFGCRRLGQHVISSHQMHRDRGKRSDLQRRAHEDIGIDDHPHPGGGSTSCCACLISRSMSSSVRPAATTLARDSRRPGIHSCSVAIIRVTRSSEPMPRRCNSSETSPAAISITAGAGGISVFPLAI
jgi:hypothetical protein